MTELLLETSIILSAEKIESSSITLFQFWATKQQHSSPNFGRQGSQKAAKSQNLIVSPKASAFLVTVVVTLILKAASSLFSKYKKNWLCNYGGFENAWWFYNTFLFSIFVKQNSWIICANCLIFLIFNPYQILKYIPQTITIRQILLL